jgi:hypothetical protein
MPSHTEHANKATTTIMYNYGAHKVSEQCRYHAGVVVVTTSLTIGLLYCCISDCYETLLLQYVNIVRITWMQDAARGVCAVL